MPFALIEQAIVKILRDSALLEAVGDRVYANVLPQDPIYPAIVYQKIDGPRVHSMQGSSGLASPRFQIRAWSTDYGDAKRTANSVRLVFDGKTFENYALSADPGASTITIQSCLQVDERDIYDDKLDAHGCTFDFIFWHDEERPA